MLWHLHLKICVIQYADLRLYDLSNSILEQTTDLNVEGRVEESAIFADVLMKVVHPTKFSFATKSVK